MCSKMSMRCQLYTSQGGLSSLLCQGVRFILGANLPESCDGGHSAKDATKKRPNACQPAQLSFREDGSTELHTSPELWYYRECAPVMLTLYPISSAGNGLERCELPVENCIGVVKR